MSAPLSSSWRPSSLSAARLALLAALCASGFPRLAQARAIGVLGLPDPDDRAAAPSLAAERFAAAATAAVGQARAQAAAAAAALPVAAPAPAPASAPALLQVKLRDRSGSGGLGTGSFSLTADHDPFSGVGSGDSSDSKGEELLAAQVAFEALERSGNIPAASRKEPEPGAVFTKPGANAHAARIQGTASQDVAPAGTIALVYMCLLGPIAVAWILLSNGSLLPICYPAMLAITMVTSNACFDMANQSVSALMDAPNAASALHAGLLVLVAGVWSAFEWPRVRAACAGCLGLRQWAAVAVTFALHQLANHLVAYACTLSERVVFMNLCPVVGLAVETLIMPPELKPVLRPSCKVALLLMATGAVIFSLAKSSLTAPGLLCASLLVATMVPYRLVQRYLLSSSCSSLPLGLLAGIDGLALCGPSALLSGLFLEDAPQQLQRWFSVGSVVLLLGLSGVTFVANHILALMLLKVSTATSYMVYQNVANFFIIGGSIFLFHEVMGSKLVLVGLILSLGSGLWYAAEVSCSSSTTSKASSASADGLAPPSLDNKA